MGSTPVSEKAELHMHYSSNIVISRLPCGPVVGCTAARNSVTLSV